MGGSRRKHKRSRAKVRVGLPRKNPHVFKPAFSIPPKLGSMVDLSNTRWDEQGTVLHNYKSFGLVSNPNLLGVRSRTSTIIEAHSLQLPLPPQPIHDLHSPTHLQQQQQQQQQQEEEEDDLKSALGKKRLDGKNAPLHPLTSMQRLHIKPLLDKYGDDYQRMFMDTKLNNMQHSVATLEKLCKRYHMYQHKNPMLLPL